MLDQLVNELKDITEPGLKFVFFAESGLDVYWNERIVVPRKFQFLNEGLSYNPDMKALLTYDQYLPFNRKYGDNKNCVELSALPFFYRKDGKE